MLALENNLKKEIRTVTSSNDRTKICEAERLTSLEPHETATSNLLRVINVYCPGHSAELRCERRRSYMFPLVQACTTYGPRMIFVRPAK